MVLRMTSSGYKVRGCPGSIRGWVLKKEKTRSSSLKNSRGARLLLIDILLTDFRSTLVGRQFFKAISRKKRFYASFTLHSISKGGF